MGETARLTVCIERTPAATGGTGAEPGAGFTVFEQQLRRAAAVSPTFEINWVPVPWTHGEPWEQWRLFEDNWSLRGSVKGLRSLREHRHDVALVHTQCIGLLSCGALGFAHRSPVVLSMDASPMQMDTMAEAYGHRIDPRPVEWGKRRMNRSAYRGAAHIVPTSSWTRDSLVADYGVAPERVTPVPWGVDVGWWSPPQRRAGPSSPVKVLFVGGDLRRKGADLLIDVVQNGFAGAVELTIATGAECDAPASVTVRRGLGPSTPELRALFHAADVFALPTRADCTPFAVIEAMAAGLPVVSTTVGSISELVEDGVSGLLVQPGDARGLSAALRFLVDEPDARRAMGEAARARACAAFDGMTNAQRVLDVCRAVVDARRM